MATNSKFMTLEEVAVEIKKHTEELQRLMEYRNRLLSAMAVLNGESPTRATSPLVPGTKHGPNPAGVNLFEALVNTFDTGIKFTLPQATAATGYHYNHISGILRRNPDTFRRVTRGVYTRVG